MRALQIAINGRSFTFHSTRLAIPSRKLATACRRVGGLPPPPPNKTQKPQPLVKAKVDNAHGRYKSNRNRFRDNSEQETKPLTHRIARLCAYWTLFSTVWYAYVTIKFRRKREYVPITGRPRFRGSHSINTCYEDRRNEWLHGRDVAAAQVGLSNHAQATAWTERVRGVLERIAHAPRLESVPWRIQLVPHASMRAQCCAAVRRSADASQRDLTHR